VADGSDRWQPGQGIVTFQAPLSPEIIHFSIVDATVPFEVPFVLPTEGLGIVVILEEHFEIMNLEVDIQRIMLVFPLQFPETH
jgi:hypothetical protein